MWSDGQKRPAQTDPGTPDKSPAYFAPSHASTAPPVRSPSASASIHLNTQLLAGSIAVVEHSLDEQRITASSAQKADLLIDVYMQAALGGAVPGRRYVDRLVWMC